MNFLSALWLVAVLLAIISVAMLLLMVCRRVLRSLLKTRHERQRSALLDDFLAYLYTGDEARVRAILKRKRVVRFLPDILHEFLFIMQIEDTRPLYELLRRCGTLKRLIDQSRSVRPDRRLRAVEVLAQIDGAEIVPALDARIDDDVVEISVAALFGLERAKALPPIAEIMRRLEIGSRHGERPFRALFRTLAVGRTRELAAYLADAQSAAARVLMADALGQCDDDISCQVLAVLTRDPDEDVRSTAVRSLSRLGHKEMAYAILPRLADAAWTVRAQAAQACAALGLHDAIPLVVELLKDQQWWVRYRAAQALARLDNQKVLALCSSTERTKETGFLLRAVLYESDKAAA